VPKHSVLRQARMMQQPFRPVEITDLDKDYHAFIVRYSGDYISHSHTADEFIYVLEGAIDVEVDGRRVEVRQGEAFLVPAGKPHRPRCRNTALALIVERKGLQRQEEDR
jgi:mannose-6-phosphate isomerase-like protein (cupin superfamily)